MIPRRLAAALVLSCLVAVNGSLARQGTLPQEPLALVNANVVNVTNGTLQSNVTVVLRAGAD